MFLRGIFISVCSVAIFTACQAYPQDYDLAVNTDTPVMYLKMGHPESGVEKDYSNHALDGKYYGDTLGVTRLPNGDKATVFNGLNEYLEVADSDLLSVSTSGVLTMEAWMRPDTLEFPKQERSNYVHWMGKGINKQQEYVARMYSLTNEENRPNRISGYAFNPEGGLGAGSYFQDAVQIGEWIHYTLVINTHLTSTYYPTGYTMIYKNGQARDKDDLLHYKIIPRNGIAPYRIGTMNRVSFFKGAIGKVAVYNYELSPERIKAHYSAMVDKDNGQ